MKIKVTPNRKVVNLSNLPPQQAKVEYDSLVFGDYHFLDYSFDGESNADGDEILSGADGDKLEPIGNNLYMSAEGDVYEFIEGDIDDYYNSTGSINTSRSNVKNKRKYTIVTLGADGYENADGYEDADGYDYADGYEDADGDDDFYDADGDEFYNARGRSKGKSVPSFGSTQGQSGAKGQKGGKVKGFFKKVGRGFGKTGKWIGKQAKSFVKFVGKLKPKKGARKLRVQTRRDNKAKAKEEARIKREKEIADAKAKGQTPPPPLPPPTPAEQQAQKQAEQHLDIIPPVVPDASGKMMKQNPDGTVTEVPKENVVQAPNGQMIDKKDTEGSGTLVTTTNPETGKPEVAVIVPPDQVATVETESGEVIPFKASDLEENKEEKKGLSKGMKTALWVGGGLIALGVIVFVIYKMRGNKGKGK